MPSVRSLRPRGWARQLVLIMGAMGLVAVHAFSPTIVLRANAQQPSSRFLSQADEADGVTFKSNLGKEIRFDAEKGRFFEGNFGLEEEPKPASNDEESAFPNPLKKPEGTFFQELGWFQGGEDEQAPVLTNSISKEEEPSMAGALFGQFQKELGSVLSPKEKAETVAAPPTTPKPASEESSPFSFLGSLFAPEPTAEVEMEPLYESVTIGPDFRVAAAFLAPALLLDQIPYIQWILGPPLTALGVLFLVQTFRIRFVFTEDNDFALVTVVNPLTGETESSGENVLVGGENVWPCGQIVNYDFFPKSSPFPILVYFKETATPSESWNDGPGAQANDPAKIADGTAVAGQVHFFPAVCDSEQMRQEFARRGCGKL